MQREDEWGRLEAGVVGRGDKRTCLGGGESILRSISSPATCRRRLTQVLNSSATWLKPSQSKLRERCWLTFRFLQTCHRLESAGLISLICVQQRIFENVHTFLF